MDSIRGCPIYGDQCDVVRLLHDTRMKMKELYVFGNGACGREVLTLLSQINSETCRMKYERGDIEFLDDNDPHCRAVIELPCGAPYVCAVNHTRLRRKIVERVNGDAVVLMHPRVVYQTFGKAHVFVDLGSIVCEQVVLMPGVVVGKHCHINTGTHIGHDAHLGDYVTCSGRVHICGNAMIGDGAYLSTGAIILPGVTIGRGCTVGPGCVVNRDMKPNTKCAMRPPENTGMDLDIWKCSET